MPEDETTIDLAQPQYPIFGVDVQPTYARLIIHFSQGYFTCQDIPEAAMNDLCQRWQERNNQS